jgi:serine/threonine-protein kinase
MTTVDPQRRKMLMAAGAAATVGLAGCSGDGDGGDDDGDGDDSGSPETVSDVPEEVDGYLGDNNANGYEGELVDYRGESEATVDVGPGGNFRFGPAAVIVDSGTTVQWEWQSSGHSVTSTDDLFDSGIQNEGDEFSYTFEETGNFMYYCIPHQGNGHHGAVVVE